MLNLEHLEDRRVLATFLVTSVDDSGPGSLRQAILSANQQSGLDEIRFDIPQSIPLLRPTSPLPDIVDPVIIDASSQAGHANRPVVQLDGGLVPSGDGLKLIGGGNTIRGLSITGFRRAGIFIQGAGNNAGSNIIEANYIGVDLSGTQAAPNQFAGVIISNSTNNRIGGAGLAGNLISGNAGDGIRIEGSQSADNVVQGNLIGTDAQGTAAIPNRGVGVLIQGGATRTIVGTDSNGVRDDEEGNVISRNLGSGVSLREATLNVVAGNYLGTDRSGTKDLGNIWFGVAISAGSHHNLIGTENGAGRPNVISGNDQAGVYLEDAHENVIAGNLIGLNSNGDAALPNATQGVLVVIGSQRNRIGTDDNGVDDASERNVISGNAEQGISITGEGSDHNWVAGNFIGTDITGLAAIPNTSTGIQITNFSQFNHVGRKATSPSGSLAGNLISGNTGWGIRFRNHASDNTAAGNQIGTDITGMAALPNQSSGIGTFELATGNVIGGTSPLLGNTISGNGRWGIEIEPFSGSNIILRNSIGSSVDGALPLGNGAGGIRIVSASSNQIGDGTAAGSNQIAFNAAVGIEITGDNATMNRISVNSIYAQTIGIDLGGDGATPNDLDDQDQGPNELQNTPLVLHAVPTSTGSQIAGTLQGLPRTEYRIELYASIMDAGTTRGSRHLGDVLVLTDELGFSSWLTEVDSNLDSNQLVTATASDETGNTSELSDTQMVAIPLELETGQVVFAEDVGTLQLRIGRGEYALSEDMRIQLTGLSPTVGELPPEVLIMAGERFATVPISIIDDNLREEDVAFVLFASTADGAATGALQLHFVDDDTGDWHNRFLAEDINGDRIVSPLDALLIINFLNSNSERVVSQSPPALPRVYLDADDNGLISPIDVLLVINHLNSQGSAEGESTGNSTGSSSAPQYWAPFLFGDSQADREKTRPSIRGPRFRDLCDDGKYEH